MVDDEENEQTNDNLSFAAKFDAIPASASANADELPPGIYEAIISGAVLQKPGTKGQSVRFKFELCDPDLREKNEVNTWHKIKDEDGEPFEVGIRILKQVMAKLGYKLKFAELEETLAEITEERPGVNLKVSYRIFQGTEYQSGEIQGLCDNEVVQEYKDNVVY